MRRTLLVATTLLLGVVARAQGATKFKYVSFQGESLLRYAWQGRKVALATSSRNLNPNTMRQVLRALDKAYAFYAEQTGREPASRRESMWNGRTLVAEVQKTCGAGCGYLGTRGIEIMPDYLRVLLQGVEEHRQFDQVLFYELGRNFWFLGDKLEYEELDARPGSVTTGFAVCMRFLAMDAAGVDGASFGERPFAEFRSEVEHLVDTYEADTKSTWATTLRADKGVENKMGLGGADLFASICLRLAREFGGPDYLGKLWAAAGKCPPARTTADAVDNFVVAASQAATRDLSPMFAEQWRWPVGPGGKQRAAKAGPALSRLGE
ncbi:MAG: hypothetical protein R3F56_03950 [Planctomycetota bacterium]